jgi:hypothetical protein
MNKEDLDIIDEYLAGTLSQENAKAFKERLQTDAKFKDEFDQIKLIIAGIKYAGKIKTLNKIKQIENTLPEINIGHKQQVSLKLNRWYLVAAAILFMILSMWFLIPRKAQKYTTIALYESYFEPYPNVAYPVTRYEEQNLTLIQKAFVEYDKKNYSEAIRLFKCSPDYAKNQTTVFYLAVASLANNDSKQATQLLLSLLQQNPVLNDKVQWYLGMCYLKENNIDSAITFFKDLSETENAYTQRAILILKKLK